MDITDKRLCKHCQACDCTYVCLRCRKMSAGYELTPLAECAQCKGQVELVCDHPVIEIVEQGASLVEQCQRCGETFATQKTYGERVA